MIILRWAGGLRPRTDMRYFVLWARSQDRLAGAVPDNLYDSQIHVV